jgi:hypothetical protein
MGTLKYDGMSVDFADLLLAHVQVAVVQKLRRQESFPMSWQEPGAGGGRTSVWVHPAATLTFHYSGSASPAIDRNWAERLVVAAGTVAGMVLTDQEGQPAIPENETNLG